MELTQAQANYAAYEDEHKQRLESEHLGRTALMHDGEVAGIYNDEGDAYSIGCEKYGLGNFSMVKIGAKPVHLGAFAAALR